MNALGVLRLSWQMLARDWRAGELRLLAAALVIAVASMTSVGFFTDRIHNGMSEQAAELLAADLVIASPDPIGADRSAHASGLGLDTAQTLNFRSVVLAGDAAQLVEIKAVTSGYPLRGALRIADAPFGPDTATESIPARGEVWVEARLLPLLNVGVGDSLHVGEAIFVISQVLAYEPDRGGDLFTIAPRLLMNLADVPRTGLVQPASRVSHRLLLAGSPDAVQTFRSWLAPRRKAGEELLRLEEGRPELRFALERAQQFLSLAAMVSVLVAGVAVAASARRFARRHLDSSALMRCFGAVQFTVVGVFCLETLWVAVLGSAVGIVAGLLTQAGLAAIMGQLLLVDLPSPSLRPALLGAATGLMMVLGFALPPLLALKDVPPNRVLRRDLGQVPRRSGLLYVAVVVTMGALLLWQTRDPRLVAYVAGGAVVTLLCLGLVAFLLVRLLTRLRNRVGVDWRFGFANIARRASSSVVQLVAIGLGIMVLLLLSVVRADLLETWRRSLPPDAPNQFLINVQTDQVEPLQTFFAENGVTAPVLYPMVRARLRAVNDRPVAASDYTNPRAQRLVTREFNLSWAERLQVDNRIVAGRWWQTTDRGMPYISFEEELATTLGIGLGDVLTFDVGGSPLALKVTSLRSVEWDSFNVNFFTVLPPGTLDDYPAQWVTSFHLDATRSDILNALVKRFPNVTVIQVDALMQRVRTIIERVAVAVEYVFVFTLLAGLAVLYAAIQANQDERRHENALLRTLGAQRGRLLRALAAEFVTLGSLAGALAGLAASTLAYVLSEFVFRLDFQFNPWVVLIGVVAGATGVGLAGLLGARGVLAHPPLQTLRQA